jgi:hypothetical protein
MRICFHIREGLHRYRKHWAEWCTQVLVPRQPLIRSHQHSLHTGPRSCVSLWIFLQGSVLCILNLLKLCLWPLHLLFCTSFHFSIRKDEIQGKKKSFHMPLKASKHHCTGKDLQSCLLKEERGKYLASLQTSWTSNSFPGTWCSSPLAALSLGGLCPWLYSMIPWGDI